MEAMYCDRCRNYYFPYGPAKETMGCNTIVLALRMPNGQVTPQIKFDLCPNCMMEMGTMLTPYGFDIPQSSPQQPEQQQDSNSQESDEEIESKQEE